MKLSFLRILAISIVAGTLISCNCISNCNKQDTQLCTTDPYQHHWDSVSGNIIKNFNKGNVSRLNPTEEVKSSDKTIAGFKVIETQKKLSKEHVAILKFLLRNPNSYPTDKKILKTIFAPYFAIEMPRKKYILIGFNSEEWAIASEHEIISIRRYTCKEQLLQLGLEMYPNDKYLKSIKETTNSK